MHAFEQNRWRVLLVENGRPHCSQMNCFLRHSQEQNRTPLATRYGLT